MAENGSKGQTMSETDRQIEIWKIKRLMKLLDNSRGNGTSMISLVMSPKDQVAIVQKRLNEELGTAQNIKSRVNRLSVISAITSGVQRLKLYNKVPTNGLIIYVGTIVNEEGKEKKITFDFEPYKPINTSCYFCDNRFHTEPLTELMESDSTYGFIVMDGNGCLYGTLSGSHREVLHKFSVDLPKKHGRGGQSAMRFARLRLEKRHNYVRKVAETAVQMFITSDKPNVAGLVLAGSADFKTELQGSDMFDPRLLNIVVAVVDTSYGGENGFNQAIELSSETLANVKFIQEKKLLSKFFEEISQDTGKWVSGVQDSLNCLEMGACETLIVWENLEVTRFVLSSPGTEETVVKCLDSRQQQDSSHFQDPVTGGKLDIVEDNPLIEWLANNYRQHGCTLEFVTDRSQEGSQFTRGFGGVGAILRYAVDPTELEEPEDVLDDDDIWEDM